jgi:hypothetical protein
MGHLHTCHLLGVVEEGSTGSSRPPARAAAAGFEARVPGRKGGDLLPWRVWARTEISGAAWKLTYPTSSLRSGKPVEDRDSGRGPRSGARTEIWGSRSRGRGGWGIRGNGRNGNHLPRVVEEGSTGSSRPPTRAAAAGFGVNRKNPKQQRQRRGEDGGPCDGSGLEEGAAGRTGAMRRIWGVGQRETGGVGRRRARDGRRAEGGESGSKGHDVAGWE